MTDTNYLPAGLAYIFYSLSPLQTWEWAAKLPRNFHGLAASVSSTEAGPLLEPKQVLASFPWRFSDTRQPRYPGPWRGRSGVDQSPTRCSAAFTFRMLSAPIRDTASQVFATCLSGLKLLLMSAGLNSDTLPAGPCASLTPSIQPLRSRTSTRPGLQGVSSAYPGAVCFRPWWVFPSFPWRWFFFVP